jgi:FkbM family methyltransferase
VASDVTARAKRWGKQRLRRMGFEVTRLDAGGPRRSLPEVLAHARRVGVAPRTVIDVGVAAGTSELYDAFAHAELLLVEPMAEWRAQLEALGATRRVHVETVAAGREPGETEFFVHRVPACSSMLGRRGTEADVERRTVPVVPLDDLVARHGFEGPFVLKVDVEGAELEVLAGAARVLADAQLVLLEVSFFELVEGGAQFADVVCAMRDLGWAAYEIYNGHVRPLDGALAQVDMAFVPAGGPQRRHHEYATAEQADRLYRSWGY